jgi:hypothetical protein
MRTSNRNSLFSWVLRRRSTPYYTHGTLHFCTNNGDSLVDAGKPASHQYWGQDYPLLEWVAKTYLRPVPINQPTALRS